MIEQNDTFRFSLVHFICTRALSQLF